MVTPEYLGPALPLACLVALALFKLLRAEIRQRCRRKRLLQAITPAKPRVALSEDIRGGETGNLVFQGRVWSARNLGSRDLKAGELIIVDRVCKNLVEFLPHGEVVEL